MKPRVRLSNFNSRHLLHLASTKAMMNLKSEASRTYLSYAWWVLEPLMHMGVYYFVFGIMFDRGGEDFVVFLLIGLTHWLWFSKSVANATSSILHGAQLMMRIRIATIFFPLVIVLQDAFKQIPVFITLFALLLFFDIPIHDTWLAWPAIIVCEFILILTCAIITASIIPFMPDLSILVMTGLQFLMFVSGVFFSFDMIPENMRGFFLLNPMASILKLSRDVLMHGQTPDWGVIGSLFVGGSLALWVVIWVSGRLRNAYPRLI